MMLAAGPFGLGPFELVLIIAIVVLLFGATRLKDVLGGLGSGIREFKKNVRDEEAEEASTAAPTSTPAGAETVAAVKCPSCGSLNPLGAKHCSQCGSGLATPVS